MRAWRGTRDAWRVMRGIVLLASLVAAGACGEIGRAMFTPPRAEFRGVTLRQLGVGGGTIDVVLALTNPNRYTLTATGAQYRLYANDSIEIGQGRTTDTISIPPHDSATVHLPLDLSWGALQQVGIGALRSGGASYRLDGDVDVKTPIGTYPVPLRAGGGVGMAGPGESRMLAPRS